MSKYRISEQRGKFYIQCRKWLFFWYTYSFHDDYEVYYYSSASWGDNRWYSQSFDDAYHRLLEVMKPRFSGKKVIAEYE